MGLLRILCMRVLNKMLPNVASSNFEPTRNKQNNWINGKTDLEWRICSILVSLKNSTRSQKELVLDSQEIDMRIFIYNGFSCGLLILQNICSSHADIQGIIQRSVCYIWTSRKELVIVYFWNGFLSLTCMYSFVFCHIVCRKNLQRRIYSFI